MGVYREAMVDRCGWFREPRGCVGSSDQLVGWFLCQQWNRDIARRRELENGPSLGVVGAFFGCLRSTKTQVAKAYGGRDRAGCT
jgi:hypothetical protein